MKAVRLLEQAPEDLAQIIADKQLLLVPIGSVEWHAGHLPLGVDSLLSVAIGEELSARTGCVVAPLLSCGICRDLQPERGFFGTLDTVREQTLSNLVADLLQGYAKMGFRKVILFNGHFEMEHFSAISEGMKQVPAIQAIFLTSLDFTKDETQELEDISLTWPFAGDHAAEWETSIMLYYYPDLVHMERAPETVELDMEGLPGYLRKRYPRRASREYGEKLHEVLISNGVEWIKDFLRSSPV
jgi:creatinine amidohydrolase